MCIGLRKRCINSKWICMFHRLPHSTFSLKRVSCALYVAMWKKTRFREYSRCGRTDGSIAKEPFIWITRIKLCIFLVLMLGMPLWLFKTAYGSVHFIFTLTSSKYIQEKHVLCASLKTIWLVVARAFKLASIYFAPFQIWIRVKMSTRFRHRHHCHKPT